MTNYVCPVCDADLEACRPFATSDAQLQLPSRVRTSGSRDEFGGYSDSREPAYVCWECNSVFPRSVCYVNHRKPHGKAAAGGDA
jgi:hypothetical protein